MNLTADDPMTPVRVTAFAQGLQELGWIAGRNVRIDYRWGAGDPTSFANTQQNWSRSGRM
jgi:putative ABC transport system substrate-binding protein